MFSPTARNGASSCVATELVAQTTIDELAASLALDRLDFIKADIEGGELRMLEGARASLERFRPRLLLELNGAHLARAGDTLADAFAFFAQRGYSAFALDEHGLERLDRKTVERGGAVEEHGMVMDDAVKDVPYLGPHALDAYTEVKSIYYSTS